MMHFLSEMAEEIKLSRAENQPWGFRVTGGLDFGTPLTVIKVTAGSLAELAGLKVGDIVLQANGQPLSFLTHHESYNFLLEAGNFIELSVVRGSLVLPPPLASEEIPLRTEEPCENGIIEQDQQQHNNNSSSNLQQLPPLEQPVSLFESIFGPLDEPPQPTQILEIITEEVNEQLNEPTLPNMDKLPHDENEEIMTQEQSMPSQPVIENTTTPILSEQLEDVKKTEQELSQHEEVSQQLVETVTEEEKKELTEEEIVEIMTGHAEVLTGTTIGVDFDKLEPKKNIIEESQVLQALKEEESELEKKKLSTFLIPPNRPKIKPKEKPKQPKMAPKEEQEKVQENTTTEEVSEKKEEQQVPEDEKPNNEQEGGETQVPETENVGENEVPEEQKEIVEGNNENVAEENREEVPEQDDKLTMIQKQLAALLQLPAAMQEQLSFIQQQITNIVQEKIEELNPASDAGIDAPNEENTEIQGESCVNEEEQTQQGNDEEKVTTEEGEDPEINQAVESEKVVEGEQVVEGDVNKSVSATENKAETEQPPPQEGESLDSNEEKPPEGRKRDIKWQKEKPKRNKPFFPLTPHPRPMILPGKIKFQMNPEDAYNDEFIAETLSGNAEVITGTTIGVNFQKYQRNYDHLKSSSVLQMINETEQKSPGSFAGRPEKLLATEDYKQSEEKPVQCEELPNTS